jgi:hypothetical protein
LNLGIVTLVGLKQREPAIRLFRKALQIDPEINLTRAMASPEIRDAFDEAVKGLGSQPADVPVEELLLHDPVPTSVRGQPLTVVAFPQEGLALATLVVNYRAEGAVGFTEVKMQRKPSGAFEGVIPAAGTAGTQVAYYIVATRADGKTIASRGSSDAPLVVSLTGPAPEPTPTIGQTPPGPPATGPGHGMGSSKLVFALLFGTGGGWPSGTAEATHTDVGSPGFLLARAGHLAPEIGYWATPQLMVSVQGRFQLVTGTNDYHIPETPPPPDCGGDGVCSAAKGAFAGFVKGSWFFTGPESPFRPYVSLSLGGGTIRYATTISDKTTCGPEGKDTCVDSLAAGPLLFGPGVGFHYLFAERVGLVLGLQAIVAAPDVQLHVDANLGLVFLL